MKWTSPQAHVKRVHELDSPSTAPPTVPRDPLQAPAARVVRNSMKWSRGPSPTAATLPQTRS